ncbi:MAG: hypothetical protein O3A29_15325 [Planctomycetota bacterium]|nr:hypothetical protein [Planctomycetota bacterium]
MNEKQIHSRLRSPDRCLVGWTSRWINRGVASILCLSLCACSTVSSVTMQDNEIGRDPFNSEVAAQPTAPSVDADIVDEIRNDSTSAIELTSATTSEAVRNESAPFPTAADMVQAERETVFLEDKSPSQAGLQSSPITFDPARPRHDENGKIVPTAYQDSVLQSSSGDAGTVNVRKMDLDHVDEYLVDGGDRGYPIHYQGPTVAGVESEDTFVEFRKADGSRTVVPSNTVAVYAPRFGSLRTITGTETGEIVERVSSTREAVRDSGIHNRVVASQERQNDEASGLSMRSRASGMLSRNQGADLAHSARANQHELLQNAFEDSLFIKMSQLDQNDQAWLAKGMQAAELWSKTQQALMVVTDDGLQEIYHAERVAELSALDEEHLKPGRLRLVKVADKRTAQIGDQVTFSLRYDNLGDRSVEQVRVIDHLTARLDIIEESITWGSADEPLGTWDIADHEEGGTVLIFTLNGPLEGKSGGVITFSCRVR